MIHFTLSLAGKAVGVTAFYEKTKQYCKDYLCDRSPDFSVTVTKQALEQEKKYFEGNVREEFIERTALHRLVSTEMLQHDIFLLHGSAIAVDGACYIFIAPSGTGKSTHTRLWREKFGEKAIMVNDDKPFIRLTDAGAFACGAPWNGKHRLGAPIEVKIKGICILERAESDRIEKLSVSDALPYLLQQTHYENALDFLPLLDKLCNSVSFYRLYCTPTPNAADVAYEDMRG